MYSVHQKTVGSAGAEGVKERQLHVEEAALERDHHRMGAVAGPELGKNALEVAFYRVLRNAKVLRNRLVGIAAGHATQSLKLAAGERIVCHMLGHFYSDFLRNAAVTRMHQADGINELCPQHALEQI